MDSGFRLLAIGGAEKIEAVRCFRCFFFNLLDSLELVDLCDLADRLLVVVLRMRYVTLDAVGCFSNKMACKIHAQNEI